MLSHFVGCGAAFTICHTLDCKNGGLVMECHNELRDGVSNVAGKAFTPAHLRDDPILFTGQAVWGEGRPRERK